MTDKLSYEKLYELSRLEKRRDELQKLPDNFLDKAAELIKEQLVYPPSSFLLAGDGSLWVGGVDGGLFKYDQNLKQIGNYDVIPNLDFENWDTRHNNQINSIHEYSDNILWLGFWQWRLD